MNVLPKLLVALFFLSAFLLAVVIVKRVRRITGYEVALHELLMSTPTPNVGMSCEDYSLLVIAGPSSKDLPETVRKKMQMHEESCEYHGSEKWHQSALNTPVTPELETKALELIKRLCS